MPSKGIAVKAQDRRPLVEVRKIPHAFDSGWGKYQMRTPGASFAAARKWRDIPEWLGADEFRRRVEAEGYRVEWV